MSPTGRARVGSFLVDKARAANVPVVWVQHSDDDLVEDAHTTEDHSQWGVPTPDKVIEHTNLYWRYHTAPGRYAETVSTDSVNLGGVG